jgi:hypothetical protein
MGWVVNATPLPVYLLERPKFEYYSTVWNSLTSTSLEKMERIQQKFIALCQNHLCPRDHDNYDFLKLVITLRGLCDGRLHIHSDYSFLCIYV